MQALVFKYLDRKYFISNNRIRYVENLISLAIFLIKNNLFVVFGLYNEDILFFLTNWFKTKGFDFDTLDTSGLVYIPSVILNNNPTLIETNFEPKSILRERYGEIEINTDYYERFNI